VPNSHPISHCFVMLARRHHIRLSSMRPLGLANIANEAPVYAVTQTTLPYKRRTGFTRRYNPAIPSGVVFPAFKRNIWLDVVVLGIFIVAAYPVSRNLCGLLRCFNDLCVQKSRAITSFPTVFYTSTSDALASLYTIFGLAALHFTASASTGDSC
jgi:hypothetical protein